MAAALEGYEAAVRTLLARVRDGAPRAEISERARQLAARSRWLAGEFAVTYPPCGPPLGGALGVLKRLDSITPEELERDYHAGAALPAAPAWCYHPTDLVVHPAAVAVLARDAEVPDARARMEAELVELLAHVGPVRRLFGLAGRL